MTEAYITCSNVSTYGAFVPKVPQSTVAKVEMLKKRNSRKTSNYNFQGSVFSNKTKDERKGSSRRQWIIPFVKEHFAENDILLISDAPVDYVSLGPYDHSHKVQGYRPKSHNHQPKFDSDYYQRMIQSNFTLCPGGDHPWSMRFYEAIMAGSIPVIHLAEDDYHNKDVAFWFDEIGYRYFTLDQMIHLTMSSTELKAIADANYELFMKYQTWIHGDNVPPAYATFADTCHSHSGCIHQCSKTSTFELKEWLERHPAFDLKEWLERHPAGHSKED
jgi:hypothetical protein